MKKIILIMFSTFLLIGIGSVVYASPFNQNVSEKLQQLIDSKSKNNKDEPCEIEKNSTENSSSNKENCDIDLMKHN